MIISPTEIIDVFIEFYDYFYRMPRFFLHFPFIDLNRSQDERPFCINVF